MTSGYCIVQSRSNPADKRAFRLHSHPSRKVAAWKGAIRESQTSGAKRALCTCRIPSRSATIPWSGLYESRWPANPCSARISRWRAGSHGRLWMGGVRDGHRTKTPCPGPGSGTRWAAPSATSYPAYFRKLEPIMPRSSLALTTWVVFQLLGTCRLLPVTRKLAPAASAHSRKRLSGSSGDAATVWAGAARILTERSRARKRTISVRANFRRGYKSTCSYSLRIGSDTHSWTFSFNPKRDDQGLKPLFVDVGRNQDIGITRRIIWSGA